jgi:hypothetical protein
MTEYLFSNFIDNEFDKLHEGLSEVFDIQKKDLESKYNKYKEEFESSDSSCQTFPRNIFNSCDKKFQAKYNEAFSIGVDIPSLFEIKNNSLKKKPIIIVGQDPLRRKEKRFEDIDIATPYALHSKDCREKYKNTRLYFNLIKILMQEGYRVYLTDIFKIWVSDVNDTKKNISLPKEDRIRFSKVLKAELDIFDPLAVITWGKKSEKIVSEFNFKMNHLCFPHPSGAAKWYLAKEMKKAATDENIKEYWKETVLEYLSSCK